MYRMCDHPSIFFQVFAYAILLIGCLSGWFSNSKILTQYYLFNSISVISEGRGRQGFKRRAFNDDLDLN